MKSSEPVLHNSKQNRFIILIGGSPVPPNSREAALPASLREEARLRWLRAHRCNGRIAAHRVKVNLGLAEVGRTLQ